MVAFLMKPRIVHLFTISLGLMLWSCASANPSTIEVKESPIPSDGSGARWLDNQRVIFRTVPAAKTRDYGTVYVWDVQKGTINQDARFANGIPFIHPDTGELTYQGVLYKNYEDREGVPFSVPAEVVINPITGRPSKVNPPAWIVPGGGPHGHTSTSKVPLKEEDGYLDRGLDLQDTRKNFPIVYHRNGIAEPILLGLGSQQVEPGTKYYAFANGYLLRGTRAGAHAPSLWLLRPDGTLEQLFDPSNKPWVKNSWSWLMLTKRGPIFVSMNMQSGGDQEKDSGLYLWENGTLRNLASGVFDSGDVSPDGCHIAVVRHRIKRKLQFEERYQIQVIDVCHGGGSHVIGN